MQEDGLSPESPAQEAGPDGSGVVDERERELIAQWRDTASAPVLPPAAGYLLATLYADDVGIKDVTAQLERFPSIAARLLAVANSAWSTPVSPITRLPDACTRLGLDLVRTLSITMAMDNTFDPSKCRRFDSEQYWVTALLAAEGTTRLARGMKQGEAALTWRSAALFHNIGLLWFADRYPQATSDALERRDGEGLVPRMQRLLGIDFCRAGAWLVRIWRLPEIYVNIIAHHRSPEAAGDDFLAAATVGVAADMATHVYRGEPWTPDRLPAGAETQLGVDLAESTCQYLTTALESTQAVGRTIAVA